MFEIPFIDQFAYAWAKQLLMARWKSIAWRESGSGSSFKVKLSNHIEHANAHEKEIQQLKMLNQYSDNYLERVKT